MVEYKTSRSLSSEDSGFDIHCSLKKAPVDFGVFGLGAGASDSIGAARLKKNLQQVPSRGGKKGSQTEAAVDFEKADQGHHSELD